MKSLLPLSAYNLGATYNEVINRWFSLLVLSEEELMVYGGMHTLYF